MKGDFKVLNELLEQDPDGVALDWILPSCSCNGEQMQSTDSFSGSSNTHNTQSVPGPVLGPVWALEGVRHTHALMELTSWKRNGT